MESWESGKDYPFLTLEPIDSTFIHLATKEQIPNILKKYWRHAQQVMILKLDPQKLPGRLVFETNPGGSAKYYHLYDGHIPKSSVIDLELRKL